MSLTSLSTGTRIALSESSRGSTREFREQCVRTHAPRSRIVGPAIGEKAKRIYDFYEHADPIQPGGRHTRDLCIVTLRNRLWAGEPRARPPSPSAALHLGVRGRVRCERRSVRGVELAGRLVLGHLVDRPEGTVDTDERAGKGAPRA